MRIKSVELKNFRNHADSRFEFGKGFNVITGKNAAGKTNIVEAVFLCCIAKSPRADLDKELVRFGEEGGRVRLVAERREGDSLIEIEVFRAGKKKISINGVQVQRAGELLGTLNAVFFSPDEIKVVRQSPSERRRFMDIDLSQSDKNYFYALNRYNKILSQRNNLLKETTDTAALLDMLPVWDKQLADEGALVVYKRREFVKELTVLAADAHRRLTSGTETLELKYISQISEGLPAGATLPEIREKLANALTAHYERDMRFGNTFAGPHRDDVKIVVDGVDARTYGSCGQQRTAALSLKLAETEHLYNLSGEQPILILDDVFSELDSSRREKLLSEIKTQTIVTATEFDGGDAPAATEFTVIKI